MRDGFDLLYSPCFHANRIEVYGVDVSTASGLEYKEAKLNCAVCWVLPHKFDNMLKLHTMPLPFITTVMLFDTT